MVSDSVSKNTKPLEGADIQEVLGKVQEPNSPLIFILIELKVCKHYVCGLFAFKSGSIIK
jgi:hypothetical protein